jgi:hypothetical protein
MESSVESGCFMFPLETSRTVGDLLFLNYPASFFSYWDSCGEWTFLALWNPLSVWAFLPPWNPMTGSLENERFFLPEIPWRVGVTWNPLESGRYLESPGEWALTGIPWRVGVTWNPLESGRFLGVSAGVGWPLWPETQQPILPLASPAPPPHSWDRYPARWLCHPHHIIWYCTALKIPEVQVYVTSSTIVTPLCFFRYRQSLENKKLTGWKHLSPLPDYSASNNDKSASGTENSVICYSY